MPLYLCGESALDMWRQLRCWSLHDPDMRKVCRKSAITNAVSTKHQLNELPYGAELMLGHIPTPYHVLVPSVAERRESALIRTRVWSKTLPRGTFVDLGNDIYLSSAPFLFLQLASKLELAQLVRVGMELCGIYTLFPTRDVVLEATDPQDCCSSVSGMPPATSVARIGRFLERCADQPGHRRAERALAYMLDDSGSPMETASYMLACMPRRYGGHGVSQPVMNPTLTISSAGGTSVRRPDLYWPGRSVDVEYNSDLIHIAKDAYYRDARRQVELTAARVQVVPLTRDDVMRADNFDRFAANLAKILGERLDPYPADWSTRRNELREAVLHGL